VGVVGPFVAFLERCSDDRSTCHAAGDGDSIDLAVGNGQLFVGHGTDPRELLKLGYMIRAETVRNILRLHGIRPAPERDTSPRWRHLVTHYKDQLLACDCFTVETLFLQTIYVLVFLEVGS
jgi:hypothetical protein